MRRIIAAMLAGALLTLSSCQLAGDIFKAGMWTGILVIVAIVALVVFLIGKMMGGNK